MALSNKKIFEYIKNGDIVISPLVRENVATSSVDVTLGEFYFRESHRDRYTGHIYNIYNKEHTDRVWGTKAHKARNAKEVFKNIKFDFVGIGPNDKVILLEPGETILAHTNEFIGGRKHITTMMKARSTMGRNFIEVCKCAGWGDVGYVNRWTMEITNNSKYYSIPLVVGRRIAQIVFFETGEILGEDYAEIRTSKYQASTDIKELKLKWTPTEMLPKLWKDRDIKK